MTIDSTISRPSPPLPVGLPRSPVSKNWVWLIHPVLPVGRHHGGEFFAYFWMFGQPVVLLAGTPPFTPPAARRSASVFSGGWISLARAVSIFFRIASARAALACDGVVLIAWQHQDTPSTRRRATRGLARKSSLKPGPRRHWVFQRVGPSVRPARATIVFDRPSGRGPITGFTLFRQQLLAGDLRDIRACRPVPPRQRPRIRSRSSGVGSETFSTALAEH